MFFQKLLAETAQGQIDLAAVPQIQAGLSGQISLETYIAYLTEAYHHVKHTVPLMQAARARLRPDQGVLLAALDEYIEEETGHEAWILNDIRNSGGDPEAVRNGQPRPETRAMVDYVYRYIETENPVGFFGMVLVLEGTSTRLATQGAAAVAAHLKLGPQCFSYLTSQKLMDQVEDPADQAAITEVARNVFRLFGAMFAAIPHEQEVMHAV